MVSVLRASWMIGCTAALLSCAVACGGDDSGDDDGGAGACETADQQTTGLIKEGARGVKVEIVTAEPAQPIAEDNNWTIRITGADGQPIDDAELVIKRSMPEHGGHGTARQPNIVPLGGGQYQIDPVNLEMGGYWEILIQVKAGTIEDEVLFTYCV